MRLSFEVRVVGVVRVDLSDEEVRENAGHVSGRVEVFEEYAEALDGVDDYSHLFLISYLHRAPDERPLKIKPRRLLRKGVSLEELPTVGVFASDSPLRPNPIALTLVRLVRREGRFLEVEGLDLFDGTPILDIKPYISDYKAERHRTPDWVRKHEERPPL